MNIDELRPAPETIGTPTTNRPRLLAMLDHGPHHHASARFYRMLILSMLGLVLLLTMMMVPTLRAATTEVDIAGFAFEPQTVTIGVGDTVTWTNLDFAGHTATDATNSPPAFDTGILGNGDSASVTFGTAGTFSYFCDVHSGMQGTVVVEAPNVAVYLPLIQR